MKYKAIIFDLDGTLLDTIDDLADAGNKTLEALGYPTHEVDAYNTFVGDGIEMLVKRMLPENSRDDETVTKALGLQKQHYSELWNNKTKPYEGVNQLITSLHQKHIKMAIFSNKPDEFTKLCVSQMLPVHVFTAVHGAKEGIPKKPNPAGAIEIAGLLDALPDETLYLGDTNTDMKTGKGAGMFTVGAQWGFRPKEELIESGADDIAETPVDVLKFFE